MCTYIVSVSFGKGEGGGLPCCSCVMTVSVGIAMFHEVAHRRPHSLLLLWYLWQLHPLRFGGWTDANGFGGLIGSGHVDGVVGAGGAVGLHVCFDRVDGVEEGVFRDACDGAGDAVVQEWGFAVPFFPFEVFYWFIVCKVIGLLCL